jgi:hypothetical protein
VDSRVGRQGHGEWLVVQKLKPGRERRIAVRPGDGGEEGRKGRGRMGRKRMQEYS